MKQCWDADPSNRSDAKTLYKKVKEMWKDSYNDLKFSQILQRNLSASSILYSSSSTSSKIYQFENLPSPRNATEGKNSIYYIYNLSFIIIKLTNYLKKNFV